MKKIKVIILMIVMTVLFLNSEQPAVLEELAKPQGITVDTAAQKMFINEGASVYIYSLKDFSLLGKFGREGEGPGEYKRTRFLNLKVSLRPGDLAVAGYGKISFFDKNGKLVGEKALNPESRGHVPMGKGYVASRFVRESGGQMYTVNYYDENLKPVKEIFRQLGSFQMGKKNNPLLMRPVSYHADGERLYLDAADAVIHCFDKEGKSLAVFPNGYEKLKVTEEHRKAVLEMLKTDPRTRQFFEQLKQMIRFPEYFPLIRDFRVNNGKVYVFPFKKDKEGRVVCYVYDAAGKLLKRGHCTLREKNPVEFFPFEIRDGKVYQLVENDDEEWGLKISAI